MRFLLLPILLWVALVAIAQNPIQIDADSNLTISPARGGTSAGTWEETQFYTSRGASVQDDFSTGRSTIDTIRQYVPFDAVELWCSLGSDIFRYDCWHEIEDVDAPCPYSTADPQETWREWGLASNGGHAPQQVGDYWYRSNLVGDAGQQLPASEWWTYIAAPDTANTSINRMLTVEQYLAIRDAAVPDPVTFEIEGRSYTVPAKIRLMALLKILGIEPEQRPAATSE